jgi:Core-2/I-Branching enzyme
MRLANYISVYHKSYQFRWLFDAVYDKEDLYFVHVDRKAADELYEFVASYVAGRANVELLPRRNVQWGGWSQVAAELAAMRVALERDHSWNYFVYLSGQDFPIKSRAHINAELCNAWPNNFIRCWSFDRIRRTEPEDPHLRRRVRIELLGRTASLPKLHLPSPPSIDTAYKGSAAHMLTRDFCQWVVSDRVPKKLTRWLRFAQNPDELFFQAAIMNGPFRDLRTEDCGRMDIWPIVPPRPKVLDIGDYEALSSSSALYARKFDELTDREVLVRLATDCGYPIPLPVRSAQEQNR